ncbi:penicillin-binding protein 1A [Stutzerimonas tarimensis]|uniref:Penicillin-binding protein 1A n=1 Tax=Stutzerimonas tarimensis TaxID=1507735 RepID=A0ABV7T636_9GAMM
MAVLKLIFWSSAALLSALLVGLSGTFLYLSPSQPSVEALRSIQLQIPLRIYSRDEKLIAEFGEMRRAPIRFEDIPRDFIEALLAAEDDDFENHHGVDLRGLMRATSQLVQTGQIQSGGSTITMQVAKNFFLTSERSFSRKLNEILLALQIERELSKDEILELYVNKIYLGNRAYGIEAASHVYYGKPIQELTLAQLAMIAGLPKAPSAFNPLANPERSRERRDWILGRMLRLGKIDEARYQQAIAEPVDASYHVAEAELSAPYIAEMARAEMVARYGSAAYTDGFRVYTSITSERQNAANAALHNGLIEYDQRHGYRGPEARLGDVPQEELRKALATLRPLSGVHPAAVTQVGGDSVRILLRDGSERSLSWDSMSWARPYLSASSMGPRPQRPADVVQAGDLIRVRFNDEGQPLFSQVPAAQAALVSISPEDGAIEALVGGFAFGQSKYNRAIQAKRQPGSSFKPFIYSAALDAGYTAASLVNDAPIVHVEESHDRVWRPKNDNNTFLGPIRLREALYKSRNLVSIRLLQSMGVDATLEYLTRFGFNRQDLPRGLSMALGTATLTPMDVTAGWAVFANGGHRVEPYLLTRIESRDGELLYQAAPRRVTPATTEPEATAGVSDSIVAPMAEPAEQVIDERTAFIMTSMLRDVITRGTGRRAMALQRNDLAGKTGTTNESFDSWFSGYNAELVTTVWAGFDQPATLGRNEYGSTVALPIWMSYMGTVLQGRPERLPAEPEGILTLRIDPASGRIAQANTPEAYFEVFKAEDSPPTMQELGVGSRPPGSPLPADDSAPMDLF